MPSDKGHIEEMNAEERALEINKLLAIEEEKRSESQKNRLRFMQEIAKLDEQSAGYQRERLKVQEKYLNDLKTRMETSQELHENEFVAEQRRRALAEQTVVVEQQRLRALQEMVDRGQDLNELSEDGVTTYAEQYEQLMKSVPLLDSMADAHKQVTKDLQSAVGYEAQVMEHTTYWVAALERGVQGQLILNKAKEATDNLMKKIYDVGDKMITQYDEQIKGFEKQLQLSKEYTDSIAVASKGLNEYGVNIEEVTEAQTALVKSVTDFTLMGKQQRDMLLENAAVASNLGVGIDDYAQGIQNSMKVFGQSAEEAVTTQSKLAATARALGRDQGEFAAAYAQSAGALAKFGQQGVKAFGDLQRIAKITGMEMEKVLQLANKFDTFEDAATMTGKLNAALGGNFVNAMDMMMETDPAARFETIRDAILDSGLSFDTMSYYQKQFYTESLGLSDVGDLALMLSGDMDMLTDATNQSAESLIEQKKRAKDLMTMQEAWQAILQDNADFFIDIAQALQKAVRLMSEWAGVIKFVMPLLVGLRIATAGLAVANMLLAFAQASQAKSATRAAMGLAAFAVVLGLVVAYFMFGSPSLLVMAMFGFSRGLAAVGKAAALAAPGIASLGSAMIPVSLSIAGIALSVGAAAVGIGAMAAGFSLMFKAIDLEKMVALGLLMWAGASIGVAGSIGMAAFGLSLGGVALGLGLINEEKLKAISQFATAMASLETKKMETLASSIDQFATVMASLETKKMETLASSIERVADAMERIPEMKAMAVAATITAATTLENTTAAALTGGAAATAGADKYNITINVEMDGDVVGRKAVTAVEGVVKDGLMSA